MSEQVDFFLGNYHSFSSLEALPKMQKDRIIAFFTKHVTLLLQLYKKNKDRFFEAFRNFALKKYTRYQLLPTNRVFILLKGLLLTFSELQSKQL